MQTTKVEFKEIECKSFLHKINVPYLPFRWTANPYRGCQHDCWYCNARYTHEYLSLEMDEFQHVIFAKPNAAAVLEREFSRKTWKPELVNLGAVTDPYQPAELTYEVTRHVLEIFLRHRNPVVITTKSHHILRDLDLLRELTSEAFVNVAFTVVTTDETLRQKLEPTTCTINRRLEAIQRLSAAGITVGVFMTPVFPGLTDSYEHIAAVAAAGAEAGASYFIADVLNMRKSARYHFLPYLAETFPQLVEQYKQLYRADYAPRAFAQSIREMGLRAAKEFGIDHYDKMNYSAAT